MSPPPPFLPFVLCKLVDRPPAGPLWRHEIKFDGYRMQLHVRAGRPTWFSRNGNDWTARLAALAPDAEALPPGIYDGELCAVDDRGAPDFSKLRACLARSRGNELVYFVFDALALRGKDLTAVPLKDRLARLQRALAALPGDSRLRPVEALPGEPSAAYRVLCGHGLEGMVSKRLDSPYRPGRSGIWTKAKCRPTTEVVIGGWRSEHGTRFRSLLTGRFDADGRFVYAGGVHTGFGDTAMTELGARLKALAAERSPFDAGGPKRGPDVHFVRLELVAEVGFAEWTASGKLRQASYKGLREDVRPEAVRAGPRRP